MSITLEPKIIENITPNDLFPKDQYYRVIEQEEIVPRVRFCKDGEVVAKIARYNPAFLSFISGGSVYLLMKRISGLWPDETAEVQPALSIVSSSACGIGLSLGMLYLSHEKTKRVFTCLKCNVKKAGENLERVLRVWLAFIAGFGSIFPAVLEQFLIGYCMSDEHKENGICTISNAKFVKQLLPGPLVLAAASTAWNVLSAATLEACTKWDPCKKRAQDNAAPEDLSEEEKEVEEPKKSTCCRKVVTVTEWVMNTLLYSRITQGLAEQMAQLSPKIKSAMNIENPLIFEIPCLAAGGLAVVAKAVKPKHQHKIETGMQYGYVILTATQLSTDLYKAFTQTDEEDYSLVYPALLTISFASSFFLGLVSTVVSSRSVVGEIQKVRRLHPVGTRDAILGLRKQAEEEAKARDQEEQQIAPLLASEELKFAEGKMEDCMSQSSEAKIDFSLPPKGVPEMGSHDDEFIKKKSCCPTCVIL
jgi:hypothetical protein